jgi:hypothetical protein
MTPVAVLPMWADNVACRACRILMYQDSWTIEISALGYGVARAEVPSIEAAFDFADQCRPEYLAAALHES